MRILTKENKKNKAVLYCRVFEVANIFLEFEELDFFCIEVECWADFSSSFSPNNHISKSFFFF